jgi:uncharacterized protein YabE (DUF348 family)
MVRSFASSVLVLLILGLLLAGYSAAATSITLIVNGQPTQRYTHQTTVAGLLREAGIHLLDRDSVFPSPDSPLPNMSAVYVQLSRPLVVEADGNTLETYTQQQRLSDVLAEAGIPIKVHDEVFVDGQRWPLESDLSQARPPVASERAYPEAEFARPSPLRIVVHRSVPVVLVDGGIAVTLYTARSTVGDALLAQGVVLYPGDQVSPGLGNRVVPGMYVYIQRSTPVTILVDGTTLHTRSRRTTVGAVLAQEGLSLMGRDYTIPPADAHITEGMVIQVERVQEALKIEQETMPYETDWVATPDMPIDTQRIVQQGSDGVTKRRYRLTYENGQEVANVLEDQWLESIPSTKIVAYGTHISVQRLDTPDGPIEYWRHFRVLATSYSAATSGKPKDHPRYGLTRSGLKAGYGVIAVDPKVIPFNSQVYVPGYGKAIAGDTGPGVLGRHIDLGFDDDQPLPHWYRWVDVYLLTPTPPDARIRYVLPNWPQER